MNSSERHSIQNHVLSAGSRCGLPIVRFGGLVINQPWYRKKIKAIRKKHKKKPYSYTAFGIAIAIALLAAVRFFLTYLIRYLDWTDFVTILMLIGLVASFIGLTWISRCLIHALGYRWSYIIIEFLVLSIIWLLV